MSIRRYLSYACLSTAAAAGTRFGNIIFPDADPDYAVEFGVLADSLDRPNATGRYPIAGPNATVAYPGSMMDGWEIEMDVSASMPTAHGGDKFIAAAGIKLHPPAELVQQDSNGVQHLNADADSWFGCVNVFGAGGISGDNGNGMCSGLLSDTCIDNIKRLFAEAPQLAAGGQCVSLWNMTDAEASGCPFPSDEYTSGFGFGDDLLVGHEIAYISDAMDSPSDQSGYDRFASTTYPVIITWGHTDGAGDEMVAEDHITVACVRANVTTPGSQTPNTSNGIKLSPRGVAITILGFVFALLV
ncbi:hypothetical protein PFICI_09193 [Pestalotiopsis fici W106-1]|uniref:Uncharacterized protein n=1 Tax=Pestalotiopsis fici (strain W106-1 / CGMCC3.15140) TaxID=1229662 RepID=W3WZR9_PESFW|nr:uncharacterized protein PFICI_09193 [Pestalotiopsis fici W106-1]ETS79340.1 hypothetical protein PFICI_09193 [Pestalotiopsis fici W106-1]